MMIYTALSELEKTPVLSYDQAIKIKAYIKNKYHYFTNEEAASTFADAVHKILDNELKIFSKSERQSIKKDILANAVYRDQFFLTGYDVFKAIIHVEESVGDFLILVKEWLRTHFDYNKSSLFIKEIENYINNFEDYKSPISDSVRNVDNIVDNDIAIKLDRNADKKISTISDINTYGEYMGDLSTGLIIYGEETSLELPYEDSHRVKELVSASYSYALEKVCQGYNDLLQNGSSTLKQGGELIKHAKELVLDEVWRDALWDRISNPVKASIVAIGILAAIQTNMYVESSLSSLRLPTNIESIGLVTEAEYIVTSKDIMIPQLPANERVNSDTNHEEVAVNVTKVSTTTTKTITASTKKSVASIPKSEAYVVFTYKSIDEGTLKNYLISRKSVLADEPYFSTIMQAAKSNDINPVILFAITGQEQGFVSKKSSDAYRIANNPFNVYGSWKKYNTDIRDSSQIASITLLRLYEGCPDGTDPIKWINRKYAEDKNWHIGVNAIIEEIESKVSYIDR